MKIMPHELTQNETGTVEVPKELADQIRTILVEALRSHDPEVLQALRDALRKLEHNGELRR